MSDDLTKLMNGDPATFSSGYAGKGEESVYDRTGFPLVEIAPSFPMSDDLITYVVGQLRGACWEKEATAIEALVDRIEQLERERDAYAELLMVAANTFSEMHAENEQLLDKISEMKSSRSQLKLVDGGKS